MNRSRHINKDTEQKTKDNRAINYESRTFLCNRSQFDRGRWHGRLRNVHSLPYQTDMFAIGDRSSDGEGHLTFESRVPHERIDFILNSPMNDEPFNKHANTTKTGSLHPLHHRYFLTAKPPPPSSPAIPPIWMENLD